MHKHTYYYYGKCRSNKGPYSVSAGGQPTAVQKKNVLLKAVGEIFHGI